MKWFKSFRKAPTAPPADASMTPLEPACNFSPRAHQVLGLARQEAVRLNHGFVGTEHLLLGLVKLGQGVAVNVLQRMGVDLETARKEVEKQVGTGPDQMTVGGIPYTPRVKKVLALAAKEAHVLKHTYVGTEHILLGLLREGDGVAARVLSTLHVDVDQTRQEVLKELDPNFAGAASDRRAPDLSHNAGSPKAPLDSIDASKRYDVYCRESGQDVVVYRNALLRGRRRLWSACQHDFGAEFLELEQSNGQTVYLSLSSVVRFCEHGTKIVGEIVSLK